ncbi:E1-E2 ATPase-domain-containing protein [Irpex rosettiformis]|uniref:E1-E2 ATPase-domain-containing protein n=1 Tax=Irpex rosettiformis TaxID=378272 RepID=A0ACB8UEW6_9APHY|nr:E1-E2 ATPase-domain-containing protein [Irpex rosettiformis]
MSPSCCGDTASSNVHGDDKGVNNTKTTEGLSEEKCCSDSACGCDDTCLDELARAICAEDAEHIHSKDDEADSIASEETCKCDNATDMKTLEYSFDIKPEPQGNIEMPPAASSNGKRHSCGLRKRKATKKEMPKKACGEHVSEARHRQKDTLTAFGCICRAMLAKGLQSCCSTRAPLLPSITTSLVSLRKSNQSRSSLDSCCSDGGCCAKANVESIRFVRRQSAVSVASCAGKSCCAGSRVSVDSCAGKSCCAGSQVSVDSCTGKSCCARPRSSIDSCGGKSCCARSQSLVDSCGGKSCCARPQSPVDSCAGKSCCGGARASIDSCGGRSCCAGSVAAASINEKVDIVTDKELSSGHAVLAVKGMTCTGCENKLIRALQAQSTISNIKTSLVLARAEFNYNCDDQELPSLVQALEKRSGFTFEQILTSPSSHSLDLNTPFLKDFLLAGMPNGVQQISKAGKGTVRIDYDPHVIGAREIIDIYSAYFPTLASVPEDPALAAGAKHIRMLLLRTVVSSFFTIPVLVMTWAPLPSHSHAYAISSLVLATIVQTAIAGPFYTAAFKSLLSGLVETDLLIVLSTTTAYIYSVVAFAFEMIGRPLEVGSFFETSTLLVTLIMFGQLASAFARQRAVAAISLRSLQQQSASLIKTHPDGREEEIITDARLLQYDDIFRVHPDSGIITDGLVIAGTSAVDESMMTGESLPVPKTVGSEVLAGTTNGSGPLLVKVVRLPGENTISDIADMVDEARYSRARIQSIVDRVCAWFVPVVLSLAMITFVVWLAVGMRVRHQKGGDAVVRSLTYAVAVLAISCPCAIGLAVPMVVLVASGVAAKMGIIFREATTIESARSITHAVFDKTGTLTLGQLQVVKFQVLQDVVTLTTGEHVRAESVALALASASKHPVARAVATYLSTETASAALIEIEEISGKGMQATLEGKLVQGGNAKWLDLDDSTVVSAVLAAGHTAFCVTYDNTLIAVFSLTDTIRPEAKAIVSFLRARNIQVAILSGDHAAAVQSVASALDVPAESYHANCLPADKAAFIHKLQLQGGKVMFCGDGTNDSVALAQAEIGVHMSSEASTTGAAAAASAASDAVLIRPSLEGVKSLIELSDAVYRRIVLNFVWAFVYNTVAILFAAGAFVNARIAPAYAGLGELVSVLPVVLIAMQLRMFKKLVF